MKAQYSGVTSLESVNGMDFVNLHQLAVYPLSYRMGTDGKESFAVVFVPGFRHRQENREELECRPWRVGNLIFGSSYQSGGDFDFVVYGYVFAAAVPIVLVKADSAEPFLFRVCRTARRLNRNSQQTRLIESVVTMSMRPTRVLTSNKEFVVTHNPTAGMFNLFLC